MSDSTTAKRPNRKRKKSFIKNARKYGKKGYYGRGSQLEADLYQYFVRIMEAYREGFENEEDKLVFVNNVFDQTVNEEVNCSCNQVGCRVVEMLIPFANDEVMKRFMNVFSDDLRPLSSDRFASHVLESLIVQSYKRSLIESPAKDDYKNFVIKVSKFLLNNLEDYISDTYGNHVIRTCLENLAQLPKEDNKTGKIETTENAEDISEDYLEIIKDYGQRLIMWPQFNELCYSDLSSGFLQVLLKCIHKVDQKLFKKYLKKLYSEVFTSNEEEEESNAIPKIFFSRSLLMLLEALIPLAPQKWFTKIYTKFFTGKLVKLSTTRNTNFAVQKIIQQCQDKAEFENMFDEFDGSYEEILKSGHSGVIMALAQTCKRLSAKQGSFVQGLMKTLHCFEPEERQNNFILCLCRLKTFEEIESIPNENLHKDKLNLHGTLILQSLLDYNKPIKVVNGILSIDTDDLQKLFSNTMGSHIVDSFVKGVFVGEKSREKLVRKMMGTYQELAASKYGSRSFEALWGAANWKCKLKIMEELAVKDAAWSNSEYGKIIAGKVNLVLFKRNKETWRNSLNKTDKSEKYLEEILK